MIHRYYKVIHWTVYTEPESYLYYRVGWKEAGWLKKLIQTAGNDIRIGADTICVNIIYYIKNTIECFQNTINNSNKKYK